MICQAPQNAEARKGTNTTSTAHLVPVADLIEVTFKGGETIRERHLATFYRTESRSTSTSYTTEVHPKVRGNTREKLAGILTDLAGAAELPDGAKIGLIGRSGRKVAELTVHGGGRSTFEKSTSAEIGSATTKMGTPTSLRYEAAIKRDGTISLKKAKEQKADRAALTLSAPLSIFDALTTPDRSILTKLAPSTATPIRGSSPEKTALTTKGLEFHTNAGAETLKTQREPTASTKVNENKAGLVRPLSNTELTAAERGMAKLRAAVQESRAMRGEEIAPELKKETTPLKNPIAAPRISTAIRFLPTTELPPVTNRPHSEPIPTLIDLNALKMPALSLAA